LQSEARVKFLGQDSFRRSPSFSGSPLLSWRLTTCERNERGHREDLDLVDDLAERIYEFFLANFLHERVPLNLKLLDEACRERVEFVGGHSRFAILESSVDRVEKRIHLEIEMLRAHPHVVEILHPTVRVA